MSQIVNSNELTGTLFEALFAVNPYTGNIWRLRDETIVGAVGSDGYRQVWVGEKLHKEHRLVWMWVHGEMPEHDIDHINGDRTDNRICNLRKATRSENLQNGGLRSSNSSGYKWVCWDKRAGKWRAEVRGAGFAGLFDDPYEAFCAARKAAELAHGDFFNDGTKRAHSRLKPPKGADEK